MIPAFLQNSDYRINETIARSIAENNQIEGLSVWGETITEETLAIILQSHTLSSIELKDIRITDTLIAMLVKNQNLKHISLGFDNIIPELKQLADKSSLKTLKLNCDKITNAHSHVFVNTNHLIKLEIASNSITEKFSAPLSNNPHLAELHLHGERIKTPGPQYFAATPSHPNRETFKDYLLSLKEDHFFRAQLQHDAVIDLVLSDLDLQDRLNKLNPNKNTQSFKNSCVAKNILTLLEKYGFLPPEKNTVTTELMIYREIWSTFGEEADIKRVVNYLTKQNFNICIYENDDLIQQRNTQHERFRMLYNNYLNWIKPVSSFKKQSDEILTLHDPENYQLIFVIRNSSLYQVSGLIHCIMLYQEKGTYCLYDPSKNNTFTVNDMNNLATHINAENWELLGITLEVSKQRLSIKNKTDHFLFKPEPKSSQDKIISNINENNCTI